MCYSLCLNFTLVYLSFYILSFSSTQNNLNCKCPFCKYDIILGFSNNCHPDSLRDLLKKIPIIQTFYAHGFIKWRYFMLVGLVGEWINWWFWLMVDIMRVKSILIRLFYFILSNENYSSICLYSLPMKIELGSTSSSSFFPFSASFFLPILCFSLIFAQSIQFTMFNSWGDWHKLSKI